MQAGLANLYKVGREVLDPEKKPEGGSEPGRHVEEKHVSHKEQV